MPKRKAQVGEVSGEEQGAQARRAKGTRKPAEAKPTAAEAAEAADEEQSEGDEERSSGDGEGGSGCGGDDDDDGSSSGGDESEEGEGEDGSGSSSSGTSGDSYPEASASGSESADDEEGEAYKQLLVLPPRPPQIDVDFEFFDPAERDFLGLKALLNTYLDGQQYDCSGLVNAIIQQGEEEQPLAFPE
ncbi:Protein BCCIP [Tetrabaena socialis]|uniref:Protein BCCIP n=1 Tax=Tetrabaena socialis TaxID=47790 RepID=A0A2J7ZM55_9CHLO|nr:Protein BCCIP [Tetrabaena socialis]|eukprot:PNH01342.1 Protein BCCIP [Tetrabaena socialis]